MKIFQTSKQQLDDDILALRREKRALTTQKYRRLELERKKTDDGTINDNVDYVLDGIEEQIAEIDFEIEEKKKERQTIVAESTLATTPQKSNVVPPRS